MPNPIPSAKYTTETPEPPDESGNKSPRANFTNKQRIPTRNKAADTEGTSEKTPEQSDVAEFMTDATRQAGEYRLRKTNSPAMSSSQ